MAEVYKSSFGQYRRQRRGGRRGVAQWLLLLLDIFVGLLLVLFSALTAVSILCQYIPPAELGAWSIVSLAAPIIYIVDLAVFFYWIVRLRWWLVLVAAPAVVVGLYYMPLYYRIDLMRRYATHYDDRDFVRLATYNICGNRTEQLGDYLQRCNPDILCLQEVRPVANLAWEQVRKRYNVTSSCDTLLTNEIASRYPLLRSGTIDSLNRRRVVWADVKVGMDTLRVINLHLNSTTISDDDTNYIEHHEYMGGNSLHKASLKEIVRKLASNNVRRSVQADAVARFVAESPYRVVVCGDLNDVPMSYTYRTILDAGLEDAFNVGGSGYSYTFNRYFNLLRIDHVFCSEGVAAVSYEVDNSAKYSDHYPVFVRVKLK